MTMPARTIESRYASHVGQTVGSLTFNGIAQRRGDSGRVFGEFRCACGRVVFLPAGRTLRAKTRTHCGCKTDHGAHRRHGMRNSPEYSSWSAMKARCLDPDNKDYPRWGGRGITIFASWIASFEAFYSYMGDRPAGTSLDRIDNAKGYVPGNVRWATTQEQQCNRRTSYTVEIDGVEYPSMEAAADAHSVSVMTITRWCDGYTDARRAHLGPTPPKPNCSRRRTYQ